LRRSSFITRRQDAELTTGPRSDANRPETQAIENGRDRGAELDDQLHAEGVDQSVVKLERERRASKQKH
jgi:hypothetical protein